MLREHEAGAKTEEVWRRHGISSATFYKWKAKYGGLEVSEARRLKTLKDENRRLKRLLAESMLDPRRSIATIYSHLSVRILARNDYGLIDLMISSLFIEILVMSLASIGIFIKSTERI